MTLAKISDVATDHGPPGFLRWVAELVHPHCPVLIDEPAEVVARALGITASHVRVLVHRARERIRSCAYEES
jgi:hypothetical protein